MPPKVYAGALRDRSSVGGDATPRLRWIARILLAPAFGCLIALNYLLGNLIPFRIALIILAISSAGETYNLLAIAARLILPTALPLIVLFAMLIAGRPR